MTSTPGGEDEPPAPCCGSSIQIANIGAPAGAEPPVLEAENPSNAMSFPLIYQIPGTLMMVRSPRVWNCSRLAFLDPGLNGMEAGKSWRPSDPGVEKLGGLPWSRYSGY